MDRALPRKRPVPMAPPMAIMVSCRGVSSRRRPASRATARAAAVASAGSGGSFMASRRQQGGDRGDEGVALRFGIVEMRGDANADLGSVVDEEVPGQQLAGDPFGARN